MKRKALSHVLGEVDRETIAKNIVSFAREKGLLVRPGLEPLKWADLVRKEGGCPCVPERRGNCPCNYVEDDLKLFNRCRCGLFVNKKYLQEFNTLVSKRRRK